MAYDFDLICIGLGPAGMAVSVMGAEMGLKVCAIEKNKIGGECMNVGCIPSKAVLRMAHLRHAVSRLGEYALGQVAEPEVGRIFEKIRGDVQYINENKTRQMFKKVELILGQGEARLAGPHRVSVGGRALTAKRLYLCIGTRTAIPPVPGLREVPFLTNENIFELEAVPRSLVVIGGGAVGCELAQAFALLGCRVSLVHQDAHLIPAGEPEAGRLLEAVFRQQGIEVLNGRQLTSAVKTASGVRVTASTGETLEAERLLVAAGKTFDPSGLGLETAGVRYTQAGITVNDHLETSQRHIYAAGDCNGHTHFTHAAMQQGMLALMNSLLPGPFKRRFRQYPVPWTIFTQPQVSHTGLLERELKAKGIRYEAVESKYADYGAAIAENETAGYVRAYIGPTGRIYGASVVGEGSGEIINEWTLAIQKKLRITDILFAAHSFPTMGFLTKRVSEGWMMNRMKSKLIQKLIRMMF